MEIRNFKIICVLIETDMDSQKPHLKLVPTSTHSVLFTPLGSSAGDPAQAGLTCALSLQSWDEPRDGARLRLDGLRLVSIGQCLLTMKTAPLICTQGIAHLV